MIVPAPRLAATIERRLLVNYSVDPSALTAILPEGLRPQLVRGRAVAGVCLLRLGAVRPAWVRPAVGWGAENGAHRVAVEWDDATGTHAGVFIPERHSASWLPVVAGGRLFPGVHRHARFTGRESADRIEVAMSAPGATVSAEVAVTDGWVSELFDTLEEASAFFRTSAVGWSPSRDGNRLEGMRLETTQWRVQPGRAVAVASSFFDALPPGSATLDHVLVMRGVPVTWSQPVGAPPAAPLSIGAPSPAAV